MCSKEKYAKLFLEYFGYKSRLKSRLKVFQSVHCIVTKLKRITLTEKQTFLEFFE